MLAVSIGYEILVFPQHDSSANKKCLIYDKDRWEIKEMELVRTVRSCSRLSNCSIVYQFLIVLKMLLFILL